MPRRRGLTLIELLVAIFIILIVAALIISALVKLYRVVKSLGQSTAQGPAIVSVEHTA